jgi:hypothetical protein
VYVRVYVCVYIHRCKYIYIGVCGCICLYIFIGGCTWPFLAVQLAADVNFQGLLARQRRAQLSGLSEPNVAMIATNSQKSSYVVTKFFPLTKKFFIS